MKIKRQTDLYESYNTTSDWLGDFFHKLEKKSYNIENLKSIRQMNQIPNSFATIEEKMADIKRRIGFDNLPFNHEKIAESSSCGCGGHDNTVCACEIKVAKDKKHSKEKIESMATILKYIEELCKHEHELLTPMIVISRCREEPGLSFNELPINMEKLNKFIESKLSQYEEKVSDISYIPRDNEKGSAMQDEQAEYWSHAFPHKN